MKRIVILLTALLVLQFCNVSVFGQIKDIANMVTGLNEDKAVVENLFQAYLKPYANAFGANLNGGWYNTAKPHKLFGFDLTLTISTSFVPSSDKTFDPSKLLGSKFKMTQSSTSAPTVAGDNKTGPEITYLNTVKFKTPKGTGVGIIPSPMLQLGIGLIKQTDVTVRYMPTFNIGDYGSIDMWGVGLKHSLKQWIPGIKMAPFFNLSVMGGFTKLTTSANLNLQQDYYSTNLNAVIENPSLKYNNQKMEFIAKGFTGNVLASFDLPIITFYGGVGFSSTNTSLKLKGDYPMAKLETTGANAGKLVVKDANKISNPLDIEMKSMDGSKTKPRLNAGFRLKFAVVTLHFDYTYANYSVATAGLGISFR